MNEVQTEQGVQARKIGNVPELGDIYYLRAPLDKQVLAFNEVGAEFVDVEEAAQVRLAGVSDTWTRTSIVPIAIKGGRTILYRSSPIMTNYAMALAAVKAHRNGQYLEAPSGFYESVKAIAESETGLEPEDRTALVVVNDGNFDLTPEKEESRFLFRRATDAYFKNKTPGNIPFHNLSTGSNNGVMNYLWFSYPQDRSDLYCRGRGLGNDDDAFGVRRTGKASAENSSYSLTEIARAHSTTIPAVLKDIGLGALGELVARPLAKGLLERLRVQ